MSLAFFFNAERIKPRLYRYIDGSGRWICANPVRAGVPLVCEMGYTPRVAYERWMQEMDREFDVRRYGRHR